MTVFLWIGIMLCISQSAMRSGLNLAFFTVSKLELQIQVAKGDRHAQRVLSLRKDANFLLVTILWGNGSSIRDVHKYISNCRFACLFLADALYIRR